MKYALDEAVECGCERREIVTLEATRDKIQSPSRQKRLRLLLSETEV